MNTKWLLFAIAATLLAWSRASSDEPSQDQADAVQASAPAKAQPADGISAQPADRIPAQPAGRFTTLQGRYAESLGHYFSVLDVSDSLVAANGLGIDVAVPEAALRAQLGLAENKGLAVTAVPDESIGKKAGLQVHDLLLQVYGHDVGSLKTFLEMLEAVDGQPVKLQILRGGKTIELEATPKKPAVAKVRFAERHPEALAVELVTQESYRIGVTLSEADDTLRAHLRLAAGEGLVVTEVVADSAAAAAGILQHDVLVVLDGKRLTTVDAINAQIQEIKEKAVELRLLRSGKDVTLPIAPRKSQSNAFIERPITYWDVKNCQSCHANPWGDKAHAHAALRLSANQSVWTDGSTIRLWNHLSGTPQEVPAATTTTAPQAQINLLKQQLAEIQQTLTALEGVLAPQEKAPAKQED